MPRAIIIAGPNGAGKTTFARALFELEFEGREQLAYHLNADELARARGLGLVAAGRAMLEALEQAVAERSDFVVETTLASRGYARRIPGWQAAGLRCVFALPGATKCRRRRGPRGAPRRGGRS